MKKRISMLLAVVMCLTLAACSTSGKSTQVYSDRQVTEPQIAKMRLICELATMQCYYHNVAKYYEASADGSLWWKKDRKFWVEYSGVVSIGVDTSLLKIEVNGEKVHVTIPTAKVLDCKVDETTLTKGSFIVAKDSASVEAEHQTAAFKEAQANMRKAASADTALLASAQQRVQQLLEDYINNIGSCVGKSYQIEWTYLDGAEDLHGAGMPTNP